MKGYNDRLRNLETNDAVYQAQKTRDTTKEARGGALACGLWRRASDLYGILSEAWEQHHAPLMLQDRHRPSSERHFQLMLLSDELRLSSNPDAKPGFYCSTSVEVADEPEMIKSIHVPVRASAAPIINSAIKPATPLQRPSAPRKLVMISGK